LLNKYMKGVFLNKNKMINAEKVKGVIDTNKYFVFFSLKVLKIK